MQLSDPFTLTGSINLKSFVTLIFTTLLMGIPFVFLYAFYPDLIHSISFAVSEHRWFFRFLRWGFIFTFVLVWPYLIRWIGRNGKLSPEQTMTWQTERFRIAVWLILFEIVIGESIFLGLTK